MSCNCMLPAPRLRRSGPTGREPAGSVWRRRESGAHGQMMTGRHGRCGNTITGYAPSCGDNRSILRLFDEDFRIRVPAGLERAARATEELGKMG